LEQLALGQNCSACHQGGGTGELSHYDRVDQITPNYPADVVLATDFYSNVNGDATYNDVDRTCSGVSCHGGLITPDWLDDPPLLPPWNVNTDCTRCHSEGTSDRPISEYNSYYSGRHIDHLENFGAICINCHNTDKLATNHFTNLENPTEWLNTAGATIDGTTTGDPGDPDGIVEGNYDEATKSCSPTCHGEKTWE
jgi:predicted CxxxxCH...CXXCH cytochrome family protein